MNNIKGGFKQVREALNLCEEPLDDSLTDGAYRAVVSAKATLDALETAYNAHEAGWRKGQADILNHFMEGIEVDN